MATNKTIEYSPETWQTLVNGIIGEGICLTNGLDIRKELAAMQALVEAWPYGEISAEYNMCAEKREEAEAKSRFYINVLWYAYRGTIYFKYSYLVLSSSRSSLTFYTIRDRSLVWRRTFPERANKLKYILNARKLKKAGIALPEGFKCDSIADTAYGLALVRDEKDDCYLCSPLGCVKVKKQYNVVQALRSLKITVPRDPEKRTWEHFKNQFVLEMLKR